VNIALGLAVVFATIVGPIAAVYVTRRIDRERAIRERQLDLFRALMRTRRTPLAPDHVNALNLVEIEFNKVSKVLDVYRDLMRHIKNSDAFESESINEQRSLLTKLLSTMSAELGYAIEHLDVFEGDYYYPALWGQSEEQQIAMRLGLIELLSGKRSLSVSDAKDESPSSTSPFQALADRLTKP
jgi:hypothetical protein